MASPRSGGSSNRRMLGRRGEDIAEDYLRAHGFRILARNVHLRHAEIDIVALDRDALCIVEVRMRANRAYGSALESVDRRKQRRLARAAAQLIATRPVPRHRVIRFDVIAIDCSHVPPIVDHVRDAFDTSR